MKHKKVTHSSSKFDCWLDRLTDQEDRVFIAEASHILHDLRDLGASKSRFHALFAFPEDFTPKRINWWRTVQPWKILGD